MTEIRCVKCNRLLFKSNGKWDDPIEIKCPKCSYLNHIIGVGVSGPTGNLIKGKIEMEHKGFKPIAI